MAPPELVSSSHDVKYAWNLRLICLWLLDLQQYESVLYVDFAMIDNATDIWGAAMMRNLTRGGQRTADACVASQLLES